MVKGTRLDVTFIIHSLPVLLPKDCTKLGMTAQAYTADRTALVLVTIE